MKPMGLATLVVLPYLILVLVPENAARDLLREDSAVEWTGALAWLGASGLFVAMLAAHRRDVGFTVVRTFWLVGLALMCFVAAGEEISWGQRLLGYETPGVVAETNLQREMNLHNLEFLDVRQSVDGQKKTGLARWLTFNRLSSLIWFGYLVALPLFVRFSPLAQRLANRWGPPVPPLAVAFAAALNYVAFSMLTASLTTPDTEQRLLEVGANEIKESLIALLFAWTAFACFQRIRQTPPTWLASRGMVGAG